MIAVARTYQIFDRRRLLILSSLLLCVGFFATSLFGYFVSKHAIRDAIIGQNLPLTSSNIYSEIQKDLVRPVLISSTMASDTFLRNWVLRGEKDTAQMTQYLREVKEHYGAFSSFFVSEKTGNYYTSEGITKQVKASEPRDAWYFRVREMNEPYEINVDPDMANQDALTIFTNYRVFDFAGNYIGATGIGLTVDAVRDLIAEYQQRFQRTIYFVDTRGHKVFFNKHKDSDADLRTTPGLGRLIEQILRNKSGSYQYLVNGDSHILQVNYLPELKWYLFVEQNEEAALAGIRLTLYANLIISVLVTLIVVFLTHLVLSRYQRRIEEMATTDKLTGLLNRHAFTILLDKLMTQYRREPQPISVLLADVDHFKAVNDHYGHQTGDQVLADIAHLFNHHLRESDLVVRWGGEEFLIVLQDCGLQEAAHIAENLRLAVEQSPFNFAEQYIEVSISIGVSQYDGIETPDQTINRADTALLSAKREGRNLVRLADDKARAA